MSPRFGHCDRCGVDAQVTTGSYFNMEIVCMACYEKERAHPDFEKAKAAELAAVLDGDYNFPGIGRPDDL